MYGIEVFDILNLSTGYISIFQYNCCFGEWCVYSIQQLLIYLSNDLYWCKFTVNQTVQRLCERCRSKKHVNIGVFSFSLRCKSWFNQNNLFWSFLKNSMVYRILTKLICIKLAISTIHCMESYSNCYNLQWHISPFLLVKTQEQEHTDYWFLNKKLKLSKGSAWKRKFVEDNIRSSFVDNFFIRCKKKIPESCRHKVFTSQFLLFMSVTLCAFLPAYSMANRAWPFGSDKNKTEIILPDSDFLWISSLIFC